MTNRQDVFQNVLLFCVLNSNQWITQFFSFACWLTFGITKFLTLLPNIRIKFLLRTVIRVCCPPNHQCWKVNYLETFSCPPSFLSRSLASGIACTVKRSLSPQLQHTLLPPFQLLEQTGHFFPSPSLHNHSFESMSAVSHICLVS